MPVKQEREYRMMPLLSVIAPKKRIDSDCYVEGYAATFSDPYVLIDDGEVQYKEQIAPDALDGADCSDIIMQYNHGGAVLARKRNQTLIVEPDAHGIFVAADLSKSASARNMFEEIKNGLVDKMSWAFTVADDEYDRNTHTRTIKKIKKVYDVSAVSTPANPSTDISARSYIDGVIEAEKAERLAAEAAEQKRKKIKLMMEV